MTFMTRPLLITLYFVSIAAGFAIFQFISLYAVEVSNEPTLIFEVPLVFSFVIAEFFLIAILVILFSNGKLLNQLVIYTMIVLMSILQSTQFLSLYFSGDFINPGIMANIELIGLLVTPFTVATFVLPILLLTLGYGLYSKLLGLSALPAKERWRGASTLLFILLGLLVLNNNLLFIKNSKMSFKAGYKSPLQSMIKNLGAHYEQSNLKPAAIDLSAEEIAIARQYGFHYLPENPRPFSKQQIYNGGTQTSPVADQPLNVIVFFVESLSSRLTGVYRPQLANLTPNIVDFARASSTLINYYNHVTPTIVGIRGQLCSIFPYLQHKDWHKAKFELQNSPVTCLPHILNRNHYETNFLGYSHPNSTFFDHQMKNSGFSRRWFYQDLLDHYLAADEKPERGRQGNSDRQMMSATISFLRNRKSEKPFFTAISTVETHPGFELLESQQKHPSYDNSKLNLVYNLDRHFGRFWEYFKTSKYRNNTIVILTADHAHTASVLMKEVAGEGYPQENFDTMNMVVYTPDRLLPQQIDAQASSVDFAPSLLQLLGIKNESNSFMGQSIFSDRQKKPGAIGLMYNKRMFLADSGNYRAEDLTIKNCRRKSTSGEKRTLCALYKTIKQSHYLQAEGRF